MSQDCAAQVTYVGFESSGSTWDFEFSIETNCAASSGSFRYVLTFSENDQIHAEEKAAPNWTPADGQNFAMILSHSLPSGAEIVNVDVINDSIQCDCDENGNGHPPPKGSGQ